MSVKLFLFIGLVAGFLLSGCSEVQTTEDQNGLQLMSDNGNKEGMYNRDLGNDERFIPNQSSTNYVDVNENRPTIGTDQDKIQEVVETFDDLEPGSIFINGNDAYVTVHTTKKDYDKKEKDRLRHKLLNSITKAVPRYHIHVRVH